ncbi:hypothetical protein BC830DRAFT_1092807 [Chytriomyces sp. MP71]|nr:hypothetical protein BC830DRAFT_1092807 [Chytriomyces sp. MP71]
MDLEPPVPSSPETNTSALSFALSHNGLDTGLYSDTVLFVRFSSGSEPLRTRVHRIVLYANRFFRARIEASLSDAGYSSAARFSRSLRKGKVAANEDTSNILIDAPPGVTRDGVVAILERIYGQFGHVVTDLNFEEYMASAYFFSDQDLCDQCALHIKTLSFTPSNILRYFKLAADNDFGPYSELLLRNTLAYLCKEGTTNSALGPAFYADSFDFDWIARIVCSDVFYVKSEGERFEFLAAIIKARPSEYDKIRAFLAGSTIMSGPGLVSSPILASSDQVVEESAAIVPEQELDDEEDASDEDGENDMNADSGSEPHTPTTPGSFSEFSSTYSLPYSERRASARNSAGLSLTIIEEEQEAVPVSPSSPLAAMVLPPTRPPMSPLARQTPLTATSPSISTPLNPAKRSFKDRRDVTQVLSSEYTNSTESAIETISYGVLYTHMAPSLLARLRAEGIISPLVLGLQHKVAADLAGRIKRATHNAATLGIRYYNDRQAGVTGQVRRDFDSAAMSAAGTAAVEGYDGLAMAANQTLCFYDWVFLDPFRHKLSEVPPFRFADEFPLAKVVGSKGKVYSKPIAYAGSLWYLMVRNESAKGIAKLGFYVYRKQDRKLSGYTDQRTPVKVWVKVCAYVHSPQYLTSTPEPYVFEAMTSVPNAGESKFLGDANRVAGEDLMAELVAASGGAAGGRGDYGGGYLRCCVVLALF